MSNDTADEAEYTNAHRAFLQALLSRGTLTFAEAKPLLSAILTASTPERPTLPEDLSQEDFEEYIYLISSQITPFDLEIRSSVHQVRKERVWALVNAQSDVLTQMATVRTAEEMGFVRRVLDAMFDTYNTQAAEVMAVTGMQALKLAKGDRRETQNGTQATQKAGLTMHEGEQVLSSLVAEGWFEKSDAGFYSLSQRGLLELRTWLEDMYNEAPDEDDDEVPHQKIKSCAACRDIVTIGQRCPNLACNTRLHEHCVRNAFRGRGNGEKCPSCQTDWVDPPAVGEKAAQRGGGGGARSSRGGRRRSSGRNGHVEDEDDDE